MGKEKSGRAYAGIFIFHAEAAALFYAVYVAFTHPSGRGILFRYVYNPLHSLWLSKTIG